MQSTPPQETATSAASSRRKPNPHKPQNPIFVANDAINRAKSCAETVYLALALRGTIPLFGERADEADGAVQYTWTSYADVRATALNLFSALRHLALITAPRRGRRADAVAFAAPNCKAASTGLLGAFMAGAVAVPLSHTLPMEDCAGTVLQADLRVVCVDPSLTGTWIDASLTAFAISTNVPAAADPPSLPSRKAREWPCVVVVLPTPPNSVSQLRPSRSHVRALIAMGLCRGRGGPAFPTASHCADLVLQFAVGVLAFDALVALGGATHEQTTEHAGDEQNPPDHEEPAPTSEAHDVDADDAAAVAAADDGVETSSALFTPRGPKDVVTIVFTSGSTGTVKGVELSDFAWKKRCLSVNFFAQGSLMLLHEAVSWMTGYGILINTVACGGRVALSNDPASVFEEAEHLRPTMFGSVPQSWRALMDRYDMEVALLLRKKTRRADISDAQRTEEAHRKVTARFQHIFASCGRLTYGGAASSPAVLRWMAKVFGENKLRESYGATEVGGIAEGFGGGVMRVMHGVEFKLRDVPSHGYYHFNKPYARGELLVKCTPAAAAKQYTLAHVSADRFDNGYFCTGDVVEMHGDRGIKIIDRISNIVKLQQGVFVAPGTLSEYYAQSTLVHQVYIHANAESDFILALVVPDLAFFRAHLNTPTLTYEQLYRQHRGTAAEAIMKDFRRLGQRVQRYEVPRRVLVATEPFTVESGLLTPSAKPSRLAIATKYEAEIAAAIRDVSPDANNEATSTAVQGTTNAGSASDADVAARILRRAGINMGEGGDGNTMLASCLGDIGVDSLQIARLRNVVRADFNVDIPLRALAAQGTTLADVVNTALGSRGLLQRAKRVNWTLEKTLPPTVEELAYPTGATWLPPPAAAVESVLLLGATGFLGRHVLVALLKRCPHLRVAAVVRGGAGQLDGVLTESLLPLTADERTRLTVLESSRPENPQFGLTAAVYDELSASVDCVINAASKVDHVSDYERCAAANVTLVKRMLEFAVARRLKAVHHVSSTTVLGLPRDATAAAAGHTQRANRALKSKPSAAVDRKLLMLDEASGVAASVPDAALQEASGYASSKAVAEVVCERAREHVGVPVVIHRVGMIGPSTATGAAQRDNFVTRIFATAIAYGTVPEDVPPQFALVLNPVDYVAAAIAAFATDHHAAAVARTLRTTHFVNADRGYSLSAALKCTVLAASASCGATAGTVSYRDFYARIQCDDNGPLAPLRSSLNPRQLNNFDSLHLDVLTRRALAATTGLPRREVTPAYLQQYARFLQSVLTPWYGAAMQNSGAHSSSPLAP
jgi:thioester reductase-like protein